MSDQPDRTQRLAALRSRAEEVLREHDKHSDEVDVQSVDTLVHELHTYQIELELQNEELRHAQEQLATSRDRLADLYDFAPVGYVTLSHKNLVLEANLALADLLGVERRLLIERRFAQFIVPEDNDTFYAYRQNLLSVCHERPLHAVNKIACELRMRRRDAEPFWARIEGVAVPPNGEGEVEFRLAVTDITEKKRGEEAYRWFRELMDQSSDAVLIVDREAGRLLDANIEACRSLQYPREELLTLRMADICVSLPDDKAWMERIEAMRARGTVYCEGPHRRRDGSTFPVEAGSRLVLHQGREYVILVARDVADRKRTEGELAKHRAHLEELVQERTESLEKALAEVKTTQQQIIEMEKMAVLGRMAASVVHEINNPLAAISAAGRMIAGSAQRLAKLLQSTLTESCSDPRRARRLLRTAAQAGETWRSTRERRQQRAEIIEEFQGQVDDPEAFAEAIIALGIWEDRSDYMPLLLRDDMGRVLQVAKDLAAIVRGSKVIETTGFRSARIVFGLRSYSHPGSGGEFRQVNLHVSMEDVLAMYESKLASVDVSWLGRDEVLVEAHPEQLYQLWTNLIHNALEAMGYEGTLQLGVTRAREEDMASVQITDSGSGMTPEVQSRIFEPFFTTKRLGEGCGLGLDIAKRIVDRHHGRIDVESSRGNGTTFTVHLPLTQQFG